MLAFIILMGRVQWPFVHMSQTWGGVQESLGAADRVFEILDAPREGAASGIGQDTAVSAAVAAAEATALAEAAALSIQGLHYSFEGPQSREGSCLSGIRLELKHGETVAVVGPSGSGKTTLVRLCCGLYEPEAGSITVCGYGVHDHLEAARRRISYVPQNPYLFSGSIRDNIAFSAEHASDEEIREAARLAGADEFIMRLPEGYDTQIGEHGSTLSGGQRQRLAIARAFLRNAPLLLLDEATSALDNESERLVQQSLDLLMKDRTTLVIAHRLSTVRRLRGSLFWIMGELLKKAHMMRSLNRMGSMRSCIIYSLEHHRLKNWNPHPMRNPLLQYYRHNITLVILGNRSQIQTKTLAVRVRTAPESSSSFQATYNKDS